MSPPIGMCVLVLLCGSAICAEPQSGITGRVTDSEGAAIARARVIVHWDSSGSTVGLTDNIGTKQDIIAMTDASGNYVIDVPAGFYDVFVSADSFTPTAAKVRVKKGQRVAFRANLRADPLVVKELGTEVHAGPDW